MNKIFVFLIGLLFATSADAQWQTSNHSVPVGRGPGITGFDSIAPGSSGLPLVSTGTTSDPVFGPTQDKSSAIGSAAAFFNPTYFGNAATGIAWRFNRVIVGEATLGSTDLPMSVPDWLETLVVNTTSLSSLVSISPIGGLGITGAARTSDFHTWAGGQTGGAQGTNGFALNDDASGGNPIAAGVFGQAYHQLAGTGITEAAEFNISNKSTVVDITPYNAVPAGATIALNLSTGATNWTNNTSSAINISTSVTSRFRKGIVIDYNSLDTSIGAGGLGVAMEMAVGQSARWLDNTAATIGEVYAAGGSGMFYTVPSGDFHTFKVGPSNTAYLTGTSFIPATDSAMSSGTVSSRWSNAFVYLSNHKPQTFSALPTCAGGTEGTTAAVTDSTTATWGATVTGSGANHIKAYCDGTNWTVAAK